MTDLGRLFSGRRPIFKQDDSGLFLSVAEPEPEPEPVKPKLFETWSRSRNDLFNKYLLFTAVSFEDARMRENLNRNLFLMVLLL